MTEFANAKRLPVPSLEARGVRQISYLRNPALRFAYTRDGQELAARIRTALDGPDRFRWRKGDKPLLYGLDLLPLARERGHSALVEGESDALTLWFHDEPALGIPGASTWQEEWGESLIHLQRIYIVIEPDNGGEAVKLWLATSAIRDRAYLVHLPAKDPSELYLRDPEGFLETWKAALESAVSWLEMEASTKHRQVRESHGQAKELLEAPDLWQRISTVIAAQGYAGDMGPPRLVFVSLTSALLERPLNIALVAPSAAGKNAATDIVLPLFPEEAYVLLKAGSSRALVYGDHDYEHKTVIVAEADSIPEDGPAASAIRAIAADNSMSYEVVEKEEKTSRFYTRRIEKPGPTGLITTSTKPLGDQMGTRMMEITVPDTPEQTRAVFRAHAQTVTGNPSRRPDVTPWKALQSWLALAGTKEVVIPYADALADLMPANAVRLRRDFRQVLTCIQTVAFLYQQQRPCAPTGAVIATIEDYKMARELLAPVFEALTSEGLTAALRETVVAIEEGEEVTNHHLASEAVLARRLAQGTRQQEAGARGDAAARR
jgi:hypothetical protein